ncbi:hypothetical protein [Corallococcus exiguus]|nr:hypothetical protein [Corallococcus exiguus]
MGRQGFEARTDLLTALRLELYRQDGLLQAFVQLEPALLEE